MTIQTPITRQSDRSEKSLWTDVRRVIRRWPVIPILILGVLVTAGLFAPLVAPNDPVEQNLRLRNAPPVVFDGGWYDENPEAEKLWLGGDHAGRDILSRIIHGARISLLVAAVSLSTGLVVGTALAIVSGFYGGLVDETIMRIVDIWFALPFLLFAMVATIVFGSSFTLVLILLALIAWSAFVRNIRAEILTLKERDFVACARIAGASDIRIMVKHLLPSVSNTLIVLATLRVGQLILAEASLSFLGVGIPSPTPAWGLMVSEGRNYVATAWWSTTFPGLAIVLVVFALNFLGDWLRDRLDPTLRQLD